VTGQTGEGTSVVVSDEHVAAITASMLGEGGGFYPLWGSDVPAHVPSDGSRPEVKGWFPPAGGFRFAVISFAPEAPPPPDLDLEAAIAELSSRVPGLVEVLEPDNPIFHRTDTIDFNLILSGEIWLELDDGAETLLRPGDCVIQNGTRHAWHNRSSQPCVMAVAIVGAER
jgi:mannose-6-phosphate isomerase-like protein (cupin superfamily)